MDIDGGTIRELRENRGWTLAVLSRRARVSVSYLSMIENYQRRSVSPPVAARLAKALGCAIVDLRGG